VVDGFLTFLFMVLEGVVVVGLALELAASHQVDLFHFRALGRYGVAVIDVVNRVRRVQERRPLCRLVCCLLLRL
jgi:hypothetical protein